MAFLGVMALLLLTSAAVAQTFVNKEAKLKKILITDSEPFVALPSSVIAFPGEEISFKCHFENGAAFSWWFDGQPIAHSSMLQLNVTAASAGQYICRTKHPQTGETKKAYASLTIPDLRCVSEWEHKRSNDIDFYHARWWTDKETSHVYFDLMARAQSSHWVGIGFSQERMPEENDDILIGWTEGSRFTVQDRHFSPDAMPLLDLDQSGLTLLSGTRKNGITRLQFKRRLISPDPQDTNLDKCQYFFLAWKGNVISRINITKQKRILVSNAKMCPMDCVSDTRTVLPFRQKELMMPPHVTVPITDLLSGVGNTVVLPFKVSYDGLCPAVTLFNGTVPIASVSSNGTSVSDRVTVWCNGTVQIKKVACYDSGSFVLVAKSAHGVADGAVTLHVVHEFPLVFAYTSHSIVDSYKQQYCTITCVTHSQPKPVIYWTKNGRLLSLKKWQWNSATGRLAVPCFTRQDTSIYRCIATITGLGTDSKTIPITVVESDDPEAPTIASLYQLYQSGGGQQWKALDFRFRVRLAIVNNFTDPIELWWINYEGQPDELVSVQPNNTYFMYTYRSHPILARNTVNGHWLTLNGRFPFFPNPVWQERVTVCDPYTDDYLGQPHKVTPFRSLALMHKVYVRFINFSPHVVRLIWLGLDGSTRLYNTMKPHGNTSLYTYEGHLWLSRNVRTGENMLIGGLLVFTAPDVERLDVIITEARTCHMKPPQRVLQRETFFVFGCDGIHIVDAVEAQVSNFLKANTTVVVGDNTTVLCSNNPVDVPSQSRTLDWRLNGFRDQTNVCYLCRWGQPARACSRYIYVPEMSTARVYVVDVVTEEVVHAIQLDVLPHKVDFYYSNDRSQVWIQTFGTTLYVVESPCNMDSISIFKIKGVSNMPTGHMSVLHQRRLRGSHTTALVWSHTHPFLSELNLYTYHFSQTGTDMTVYGCQSTVGWGFTLNGHAFASCYEKVGQCPLLEINTLTMQVIHSKPMKTCALSHTSPDGQFVVILPQFNNSASPNVVVFRVAASPGEKSIHICTIPIRDVVGKHFVSDVVFVGKTEGWNIYMTFKELKVLAKVSLNDCRSVLLLDRVGRMLKGARSMKALAGWSYQRHITMIGLYLGRYLATPAQSQDLVAVIDMDDDDKVRMVKSIDRPYYIIGGGGSN